MTMDCRLFDLGLVDFKVAEDCQNRIFKQVKDNAYPCAIVLYHSSPVITLGRNANTANIIAEQLTLQQRNIQTYRVRRGGDVTYHGPGQLIAYPIFNLRYIKKDINFFLRGIEDAVIRMLEAFGIKAIRRFGLTGVWINSRKISSVGVSFSNWISCYGTAVNIKNSDLCNFSLIRPCGMDVSMTSLESELEEEVDMEEAKNRLLDKFKDVFNIGRYSYG